MNIITIPAIAAIVYTIVDIIKTASNNPEKFKRFIPLFCSILGGICGLIAFYFIPGVLETNNVIVAFILGAASGLSATGTNQLVKQITNKN